MEIDGGYQQNQTEHVQITKQWKNQKTGIQVEKLDEKGDSLPGAILQIKDKEGNIIEQWESSDTPHNITGLEAGKEYIIEEIKPAQGYVTEEETHIIIGEDGQIQGWTGNLVQIPGTTTKLEIEIKDPDSKQAIPGIEVEIYKVEEKEDGKKEIGEKVGEYITTQENKIIEKLPIGEYVIKEKPNQQNLLNQGYVTEEDQYVTIENKHEVQKVSIEQPVSKIEIELIDKDSKQKIANIQMEIYKIITKEDGSKEIGEKVGEFTTQEENYKTQRLPIGEYVIRQKPNQKELEDKGYITNQDTYINVKDQKQIQKTTIEQEVSKIGIRVIDKQTKETVKGAKLEIYKAEIIKEKTIDEITGQVIQGAITGILGEDTPETQQEKEQTENENIKIGEKVGEITTQEEASIVTKLGMGVYVIKEQKEGIIEQGYVRMEDQTIRVENKQEVQTFLLEQDRTKIAVSLLDKETKEPVIGGVLVITDKQGKEITQSWVTNGNKHKIEKLPVGEYYLEQLQAPTQKGYVKTKKIAFEVKEMKETQEVEMLQDYTQIQIKPKDEETGEEIKKDIELIIKDKDGNEIGKITPEEIEDILERLPVGEYVVETSKVPYGYKPGKVTIEIKDKQGIQIYDNLKLEREEFDLSVESYVEEIKRNDKTEYKNKKQEKSTQKVDIKDKNIPTEQIEIRYKIQVKNEGKITGQVGKIEIKIPAGMKYIQSNNKSYWKEENGKIITTDLKGRDIKEGEEAEAELILNWKNGIENFGTKQIEVEIKETKSDIGFKETNINNNKAKSQEVIIGVSTGEMNLVYTCWGLLAILIIVEIVLSRKTKIKKFGIKDKTLKYKK